MMKRDMLYTFRRTAITVMGLVALFAVFSSCGRVPEGEDWPSYRHDNRRSAVSGETLEAAELSLQWSCTPSSPPNPAWAGPAKWDAYAKVNGMRSMRDYDSVFHVSAAGNAVFFGSSSENTVVCLDARNGRERWVYFTDGPVRITPCYADGRVYAGSDDGYAYCLDAANGKLIWKYKPSPEEALIPYNGAFISPWPVRTGVMVDKGIAYFGAGLLPWKLSYLCAVDAANGAVDSPGCFQKILDTMTLEGAMLASDTRLFLTQGRVPPALFDRRNGTYLGQVSGGGGVFALLTPDSHFIHGPGNKTGWMTESNTESRERIAQYPLGNAMLAAHGRYFILSDTALSAVDPSSHQKVWNTKNDHSFTMILAGKTIYAGGDNSIAAFDSENGSLIREIPIEGRVYGLAAARGRLYASTDLGTIHCFAGK